MSLSLTSLILLVRTTTLLVLVVALLLEGSYTHIYNNLGHAEMYAFLADISKSLYEKPYFEKLKAALRPGGIICSQGETKRGGGCGQ